MKCCFNLLKACTCDEEVKFLYRCPFCNARIAVPRNVAILMFASECPTHAKVMEERCFPERIEVVVVHRPCAGGCYECADGDFLAIPLD